MQNAQLNARIAAVRSFNRFYTVQIGLLRKSYLDSPYSLAEMRVLYELAHAETPNATDVAKKLGLDAGYLSRVLRAFEKQGLITRVKSKADARRSDLKLTASGRRAFKLLDSRSQGEVGGMLSGLSEDHQARLVSSMHAIEKLLGAEPSAAQAGPYTLREPRPGDFGWIVQRHAALYAEEYQWTGPFEGMCAEIVAGFANTQDRKRERCWIAVLDGENVGSIMLVKDADDVARIRLFLVEPTARGLGIGKGLVEESLRFARKAGYRKVTLWTHSVLTAARNIYERAGFKLVASETHNSWGKEVVGETWNLLL